MERFCWFHEKGSQNVNWLSASLESISPDFANSETNLEILQKITLVNGE